MTAAFRLHNHEANRELKVNNNIKVLPFFPVELSSVSLLRRLADSGWGAGAKTLRIAALSLIYSTAEYCAPAWCRSAHTYFIDSVLDDALHIVTGCLRPTPTDTLPALSGIQPDESQAASKERLKSRHPFVPSAQKLLHNLSESGIPMDELDM